MSRQPHGLAIALVAVAAGGCDEKPPPEKPAAASAKPKKPLDRLAPGELAGGTVNVFGFVAPRRMRLERKYPDAAHLTGAVSPEAVANYVRKQVAVQHVEVGAARTVFPKAAIRGGKPGRVYRIEVVAAGPRTRLLIKDITPPPTTQGISEAERWKRAGMSPDGKLLNRKKLK